MMPLYLRLDAAYSGDCFAEIFRSCTGYVLNVPGRRNRDSLSYRSSSPAQATVRRCSGERSSTVLVAEGSHDSIHAMRETMSPPPPRPLHQNDTSVGTSGIWAGVAPTLRWAATSAPAPCTDVSSTTEWFHASGRTAGRCNIQ